MRRLFLGIALMLVASASASALDAAPANRHVRPGMPQAWECESATQPIYGAPSPAAMARYRKYGTLERPYYRGPPLRTIKAEDIFYETPDRGVHCRVHGLKLACFNGRHLVTCDPKGCRGGRDYNPPMEDDEFADAPGSPGLVRETHTIPTRLLPSSVLLVTAGATECRMYGKALRCRMEGTEGGFTMSGTFLRVESYTDVGDGWPWDGKCHSDFETTPGM